MSRIGRQPVAITEGVTVTHENGVVKVVGLKGELSFEYPDGVEVAISEGKVIVSPKKNYLGDQSAVFGLVRAQIANMIEGVTLGFSKKLELTGVGYRAQVSGNDLTISVGFSHPVIVKAPSGIQFGVAENIITVSGINKVLVGDVSSRIRAIRKPEPYKGKGIKYVGERIRRKVGKAAKAVGAK